MKALLIGAAVALGLYVALRPKSSSSEPSSFKFLHPGDLAGLVGDSLAVGLGAPLKAALAEKDITLDARGKGATITGGWLVFPELDQILAKKPRAVFVSLGTNDCHFDGKVCDAYPANIKKLAQKIRDAGAEPIFLSHPDMPWEASEDGLRRMQGVESAMRAAGTTFKATPMERAPDKIHVSPSGNKQWAKEIVEAVA